MNGRTHRESTGSASLRAAERLLARRQAEHRTESVYRRYAIVAEADLREGVAKLAALHAARGTLGAHLAPKGA